MQSQSQNSEEIHYSIDHCLFFESPEKDMGTLLLSGWCFHQREGTPLSIEVSEGQNKISTFRPDRERPDIRQARGEAALPCGFHVYLPISRRLDHDSSVEIAFCNGTDPALEVSRKVTHIHDFIKRRADDLGLSEIGKSKLSNLVLNETERIHHVKKISSSPIYLMIDPSWTCNLDCPFCHANRLRKAGFSLNMMDQVTFDKIMDRFGEKLVMVHLANWGEPFLNTHTLDYIRAMKEREIHVVANSNLNHPLTDEEIEGMVTSGLDKLIASLDGATQETYAKYRRKGSLDLALENLRKIDGKRKELGSETPRIQWQYLRFEWNEEEVEPARNLAEALGCDEFVVKEGVVFDDYTPSLADRDISFIDAMKPEVRDLMGKYYFEREEKLQYFGCDNLYHQMVINADGSILPCGYMHEPRHLFGSVHPTKTLFKGKDRPHDIFNSAYHKIARGIFMKPPADYCQGYDPCLNCPIVTDEKHKGYVPSALDFFRVFEMITGNPLVHE